MLKDNSDSRKVVQPPIDAILLGQTDVEVLVTA